MFESEVILQEADARIAQYRAAEKRWTYAAWVFILLLAAELILCLIGRPPALIAFAVALVGIVAVYFRLNQLSAKIRTEQDSIVRSVLEETFEQVARYDSKGQIDPYIIRHTDMGLPAFRQIQGSDLIQARHRGHVFAFSNLELIRTGATEAGGSRKTKTAVFSGCWFNLQTGLTFPAPLTVSTIGKEPPTGKGTVLSGGNAEFDSRFLLRSAAPEQAAAMVTPQLTELAETLADRHSGLHLHLAPNGLIQLAIPTEQPLLLRSHLTATALQQQASRDTTFFTELLDIVINALCRDDSIPQK